MVKSHFSFQISLTPYLFHLFLLIPHLFHPSCGCAEWLFSLCAPIIRLSDVLLVRTWFPFLISCFPVTGLPYYKFTAWHQRKKIFKLWKQSSMSCSLFHFSFGCITFHFVQRIYIVCVCFNQKQWHLLAVSIRSISYTDEKHKEFIIIFVPFYFAVESIVVPPYLRFCFLWFLVTCC